LAGEVALWQARAPRRHLFFHEASTFEKQYIWHALDPSNGDCCSPHFMLLDRDEVQVDIEDTLRRYTDAELAAMGEEVITMIPRFIYKHPRVRFEGDMKDGFDVAMDALMDRMRSPVVSIDSHTREW
jgi:xyloglucan galactosyltransferase MUR3